MYPIQVASFTGQKDAVTKYEKKLGIAYKATIKQSVASGLGHSTIIFINFFTYALAVWYGGRMIAEKGYNGGQVFSVVMALMAGAMYDVLPSNSGNFSSQNPMILTRESIFVLF